MPGDNPADASCIPRKASLSWSSELCAFPSKHWKLLRCRVPCLQCAPYSLPLIQQTSPAVTSRAPSPRPIPSVAAAFRLATKLRHSDFWLLPAPAFPHPSTNLHSLTRRFQLTPATIRNIVPAD